MQVRIADLQIHKLALENPLMDEIALAALVHSIKNSGQQVPILIYRGFIVDGRNRCNALRRLGIDTVEAENLPHKTSLDKLRKIVMSTELRRHQSKSMLAIKAFRLTLEENYTLVRAANEIGVHERLVKVASAIHKLKPLALDIIMDNKKVVLNNGRKTESLAAILKDLKEESNKETKDTYPNNNLPDDVKLILMQISTLPEEKRTLILDNI